MKITLNSKVISSIFFFFALILSINVSAQDASEYHAENEGWLVSLDEAYELSQKTGKPILANFTGSDWCRWCKVMTKSVFVKEEFKTWADENVILLELDFPRIKKIPTKYRQQNAKLQQAFKISGYPTIWVFDLTKGDNGQYAINALGKTGYAKTSEAFTATCDNIISKRVKAGE